MSIDPIAELLALNEPDKRLVRLACNIGKVSALLAVLMILTTPIGWIIGRPILRPQLPTVTGAHVLGTVLLGSLCLIVLLSYYWQLRSVAKVIGSIVFLAALVVLVEYLTPNELPTAPYMRVLDPADNASKIAPNSALSMWLISAGLLLLTSTADRRLRLGQAFCLCAMLVGALALIGHSYTIESFYGIETYSELSVPGALGYVALALGCLLIRPDKGIMRIFVTGGAAGVMTRRLYAPVILLPPILGFLSLLSVEVWKWYNLPFGIAVFVVLSILLLAAVVATTSVRIEQIDIMRAEAEEELGKTIGALEDSRLQLRELSAHIQEVQEEERLRIAREVHDELGQSLTAIKMDVSLLKNQLPATANGVEQRTTSILSLVNATIKTVQRISAELRPSLLDDLGLAAALEWQAKQFQERTGVAISVDAEDVSVDREHAIAIFRIFQETLTNITRHAHAQYVDVSLRYSNGAVSLEVHDDGVGFDMNAKRDMPSLGLMGMRERADLTGGMLTIQSTPDKGTSIVLQMPATQEVLA